MEPTEIKLDTFQDYSKVWSSLGGAPENALPSFNQQTGLFSFQPTEYFSGEGWGASIGNKIIKGLTAITRSWDPNKQYTPTLEKIRSLLTKTECFLQPKERTNRDIQFEECSKFLYLFERAQASFEALQRTFRNGSAYFTTRSAEEVQYRTNELDGCIGRMLTMRNRINPIITQSLDDSREEQTTSLRSITEWIYSENAQKTAETRSYHYLPHVKAELTRLFGLAAMERVCERNRLEDMPLISSDHYHALIIDAATHLTREDLDYLVNHRSDENSLVKQLRNVPADLNSDYALCCLAAAVRACKREPVPVNGEKNALYAAQLKKNIAFLDLCNSTSDYILKDVNEELIPHQRLAYTEYLMDAAEQFSAEGVLLPLLDPRQSDLFAQTAQTHMRLVEAKRLHVDSPAVVFNPLNGSVARVVYPRPGRLEGWTQKNVEPSALRDALESHCKGTALEFIGAGMRAEHCLKMLRECTKRPINGINEVHLNTFGLPIMPSDKNKAIYYELGAQTTVRYTLNNLYTDAYPLTQQPGLVILGSGENLTHVNAQTLQMTSPVDQTTMADLRRFAQGESVVRPMDAAATYKTAANQQTWTIGHVFKHFDDRLGESVVNKTKVTAL